MDMEEERSSTGEEGVRFAPNHFALAILEQVRERQKYRRETDPSHTQDLIRKARAGGMLRRDRTSILTAPDETTAPTTAPAVAPMAETSSPVRNQAYSN
jgi:hypothetical protein